MAASSANAQTSGTITSIIAAEGQYVGAGQPIAYISANNSLSLRADVPERHAHFIASISDASFTTAYSSETRPVSDFGGRLTGTPSSSGASAGYIPVYFAMKTTATSSAAHTAPYISKAPPVPTSSPFRSRQSPSSRGRSSYICASTPVHTASSRCRQASPTA